MAVAWERREGETSKAYERFVKYLDLGPARSLREVRERLGKPSGYERQLETWSAKFDWVARAEAYDDAALRRGLERRQRTIEQVRQRYVERAAKAAEMLWEYACGERKLTQGQIAVLEKAIDRAGVIVPRQLEISGRDGKPLELAATAVRKMGKDDLEHLASALAAMKGGVDA